MHNDTIAAFKTFATIGGAELVNQLPSQTDIETTIKVIIQLGMFVIWYVDRRKQKQNDKEGN